MTTTSDTSTTNRLRRRLAPLLASTFLGGFALWVPVEKLFMSELGITPRTVGFLAAAYAGIVPLLEVPSGILADRWSRRGVLIAANAAAFASVLVAALSQSVGPYIVAALLLGAFFALQSGTVESMVYDTLVDEQGSGDGFEATLGRIRMIESAALVVSALAGGVVAAVASPRAAYVVTLPFLAAAGVLLVRFREPTLHRANERPSLREHVAMTFTTVLRTAELRPVAVLLVLSGVLTQGIFEFGPLWLVHLNVSEALYGPAWAAIIGSLGIGGALAGRIRVGSRPAVTALAGTLLGGVAVLVLSRNPFAVIAAQLAVTVASVAAGIVVTKLLHDRIASEVRASISSGVGSLTWLTFLPFAVAFGVVTERAGVYAAGWILGGLALALALLFARVSLASAAPEVGPALRSATATVGAGGDEPEAASRQLDPKVTEEEDRAAVAGRLTRQATAA